MDDTSGRLIQTSGTWGLAWSRPARLICATFLCCAVFTFTSTVVAQEPVGEAGEPQKLPVSTKEEISLAPAKVDVKPVARDERDSQAAAKRP